MWRSAAAAAYCLQVLTAAMLVAVNSWPLITNVWLRRSSLLMSSCPVCPFPPNILTCPSTIENNAHVFLVKLILANLYLHMVHLSLIQQYGMLGNSALWWILALRHRDVLNKEGVVQCIGSIPHDVIQHRTVSQQLLSCSAAQLFPWR
jgi:hypothetical protein